MKKITIRNKNIELVLTDVGASIFDFKYLGKSLVKQATSYYSNDEYIGTTVAPLAGRYNLDGRVVLHSGDETLHNREFSVEKIEPSKIELKYDYLFVSYSLKEDGFRIDYRASLEQARALNITNHSYFSLDDKDNVETHIANIESEYMVLKDSNNLAVGVVKNSIDKIDFKDQKVDDYYYFRGENEFNVKSRISNLTLEVKTSYPGVVLYTYNNPLNEANKHSAVAIECQYPPNNFMLNNEYHEYIEYRVY